MLCSQNVARRLLLPGQVPGPLQTGWQSTSLVIGMEEGSPIVQLKQVCMYARDGCDAVCLCVPELA